MARGRAGSIKPIKIIHYNSAQALEQNTCMNLRYQTLDSPRIARLGVDFEHAGSRDFGSPQEYSM